MDSVLITGSSTGIGRATAVRLTEDGGTSSPACAARPTPTRSPPPWSWSPSATAAASMPSSNNAGIAVGGALETVPIEDLRRIFDVNVIGRSPVTGPSCRCCARPTSTARGRRRSPRRWPGPPRARYPVGCGVRTPINLRPLLPDFAFDRLARRIGG